MGTRSDNEDEECRNRWKEISFNNEVDETSMRVMSDPLLRKCLNLASYNENGSKSDLVQSVSGLWGNVAT